MGTVTAGSKSGTVNAWQLAAVVVTTVLVLWIAHVYAHALAESITAGRRLDRPTAVAIARRELAIPLAAVAPVGALVLGGLDVLRESTAVWLALGLGLAALAVQGMRYAKIERLSGRATALILAVNLLLGLVIVGLKALLAH
jgi:hypothetical protein